VGGSEMTSILKYELLRSNFERDYPNATELETIDACIGFARACNIYRVETELLKQHDYLADEHARRELAKNKK
jgi:hypothetical protein